ncbi:hypothetical protein BDV97DRAFT_370149 [Delphinella strobiligena]|nr:hypothetical protein BDV97DRAFT_370149 [Delphinella strobiligena]
MKTFHTNCTLPSEPGLVSSPNVRGTLNIVWSCLTVLILCTWSIQHPSLPLQVRDQTPSKRKIVYMIVAVLAPEYFVMIATSERLNAGRITKDFEELTEDTNVKWTLTHTFANMGGFQIKFGENLVTNTREEDEHRASLTPSILEAQVTRAREQRPTKAMSKLKHFRDATVYAAPLFSRAHGDTSEVLLNIGRNDPVPLSLNRASRFGTMRWKPLFRDLVRDMIKQVYQKEEGHSKRLSRRGHSLVRTACFLQGNIWTVDASQLIAACSQGFINLPDITEEELMDKSKSDVMVKVLAITQGSWLIIQLISRVAWNPKLPSSQLGIGTVAIAFCMLFVYGLLWHKPQYASAAVIVGAKRAPTIADIMATVSAEGTSIPRTGFVLSWATRLENKPYKSWKDRIALMAGCAAGTVMGSLHLLACGFAFPSHIESLLWKVMAGVTAGLPVIAFLWMCLAAWDRQNISETFARLVLEIISLFYVLTRLFLIVEMFRCLYYLPPRGYVAMWASEGPSVS